MPPTQPTIDFDGATKRRLLTRLGELLVGRSYFAGQATDPKSAVSGKILYQVLQALHGWTAKADPQARKPGWTNKTDDTLCADLSGRSVRRAITILTTLSEGMFCVDFEDYRENGSPRKWKRICWANVAEWIEHLEQQPKPSRTRRTTRTGLADHPDGPSGSPGRAVLVEADGPSYSTRTARPSPLYDECDEEMTTHPTSAPPWVGGWVDSGDVANEPSGIPGGFTTTTRRPGDDGTESETAQLCPAADRHEQRADGTDAAPAAAAVARTAEGHSGSERPVADAGGWGVLTPHTRRHDGPEVRSPATRPSVPPCLRGESFRHQPSAIRQRPAPLPTLHPAEDDLTQRLVALGVGSARPTIREALRIGYSPEAVGAILDWYESQARTDAKGQVWWPYSLAQLVWRLRDADGRLARPERGNWKGGKCGIWSSLDPHAERPQPVSPDGPDRIPSKLLQYVTGLSREGCRAVVQRLARDPDPLGQRCGKLLDLYESAWPESYLVVPPAIHKLLMLFPLERLRA